MGKAKLFEVCLVLSLMQEQAKRRAGQEQVAGEGFLDWSICLDELVDGLLYWAFVAQMNSRSGSLY